MIYLFAGNDIEKRNGALEKFLASSATGAEALSIGKNDFNEMQFESLSSGAGLFSPKYFVVLAGVFEHETAQDFILKRLGSIAVSPNDFLFIEGKLLKPVTDAFKKAGADIRNFDALKEKKERFNSFLLANAFGSRDKLNLWIYFRQAIEHGVALEELAGILFWKAKDMILKKNYGKFSEQELHNFTGRLSYLLPESRRSGRDDEAVFEQFLLDFNFS